MQKGILEEEYCKRNPRERSLGDSAALRLLLQGFALYMQEWLDSVVDRIDSVADRNLR